MECNYCFGDEAILWIDNLNNAFIDSKGEMLVTAHDRNIRFKVKCCPMCGRRFAQNEYVNLKKGDDIYYADIDRNEVEHGTIFSVSIKDGKVSSFSVDWGNDFDEFDGRALGKYYFITEDAAKEALKQE